MSMLDYEKSGYIVQESEDLPGLFRNLIDWTQTKLEWSEGGGNQHGWPEKLSHLEMNIVLLALH